jgi:hypothetical protein
MGRTKEDPMPHLLNTVIPPSVAALPSRRDLLRSLAGLGLGWRVSTDAEPGSASKRKRKKRKKRRKNRKQKKQTTRQITNNVFGCVDVGRYCQTADQCCSGICTGEGNQKTCQAHHQTTCQPGGSLCAPPYTECTTVNGDPGLCSTTTGNAGYCAARGDCYPCHRDIDCEFFYGPGAACASCVQCSITGGTLCVGLEPLPKAAAR